MDKEFESIEIDGKIGRNNAIIHFDKIITVKNDPNYYLLFHKNL